VWNVCAADKNSSSPVSSSAEYVVKVVSNIHQIHCITFTVVAISMLTWVLAMTLCPCLSVCLSQVGVLLKWLDGLSWVFALLLHSTRPTMCFKEFSFLWK